MKAGYKPGEDISICLDRAASEMGEDGKYILFKSTKKAISSEELIKISDSWVSQYPIVLLEDGWARTTGRAEMISRRR